MNIINPTYFVHDYHVALSVPDPGLNYTEVVATTSSYVVIERLRGLFAMFGIPETLVSDNGSGFVSQEFRSFLARNGIKQTTSAPYHPATNGLAERAVQIVKKGLKKVTEGSWETRLSKVLFKYRITPHSTTGISPAELLLSRRPRSRLDLLKPFTADRVEDKQLAQKQQHDKKAKKREVTVGASVLVRNFVGTKKWLTGEIVAKTGPVSYVVKLASGDQRRCHIDHLRLRLTDSGQDETRGPDPSHNSFDWPSLELEQSEPDAEGVGDTVEPRRTYPRRTRNQPDRFEPGKM